MPTLKTRKLSWILLIFFTALPVNLFSQSQQGINQGGNFTFSLEIGFFSPSSGTIIDKESEYILLVSYDDGSIRDATPYHYSIPLGVTLDYGINSNVGVHIGYSLKKVEQRMQVTDTETAQYSDPDVGGVLMDYHNPFLGLSLYIINQPRFGLYGMGRLGLLMAGTANPRPSYYDYKDSRNGETAPFSGFSLAGGGGMVFSLDKYVAGIILYYESSSLTATEAYPYIDDDLTMGSLGGSLYFGLKL